MRVVIGLLLFVLVGFSARAEDPKPILVGLGDEFEIVLDSPADANRHWLLSKPLDQTRLKESGREYRKHSASNSRPRTCEVLRYKALAKGKTEVHLKFASLFEQDQAVKLRTNFVIVVTEPATKPAR
jgi:hypothetical protein